MRTLVIDTALDRLTVAVHDGDVPVHIQSLELSKGHQEQLAGQVQAALLATGRPQTLDRIGVTIGPGSFTGLRVGMALALGLATAARRPLVGLSTLDALALSTDPGPGPVVALINARRGQVYMRVFPGPVSAASVAAATTEAEALDLGHAQQRISGLGTDAVLVGSGAELFPGLPLPTQPLSGPDPLALARLCREMSPQSEPLKPLYLRAPDATPPTRLPGQPRRREA